tara:strand:+ start:1598 stop:2041 length:444 start_codon:yes stop_codon:yes gene_type:complete
MAEPIPSAEVKSLLDAQWDSGNVTEPTLIDVNDGAGGSQARFDLRNADHVFIVAESPVETEEPIGMWVYANRNLRVVCEIHTKVSRQRLYDIMAEIRRICHEQMHLMTNYQRIQYQTFNEYADMQMNVWAGRVTLELVNSAILMETT